jgi:hypothetical protein
MNSKQKWINEINKMKIYIQDLFKNKLDLLVGKVKPGGSGNPNDGETDRSFKKNCQESARIAGVNEILILKFYVIQQSISAGYKLNTEEFNQYQIHTAELFVSEPRGSTCQPLFIK